jgi:UDP-N-acetylmuramate dehydrogenase
VKLADYTTLGLGGPARDFITASTDTELIEAVESAGQDLLILGGGSNMVVADEGFDGSVVHIATTGLDIDGTTVTVAAGEPWDAVVRRTVAAGLAGLECLSGIPGLAGATPIQNVGAYGQEVAETIALVRVYDRRTRNVQDFPNEQCRFSYRTSLFRGSDRYLVLQVTFDLRRQRGPVRYAELAALAGDGASLEDVRAAVLGLRRRKGMVLDPADPDTRSAGSFFTNPVVPVALVPPGAPRFTVPASAGGPGRAKVPAAWLIEQAGFGRGYQGRDGARISGKHTLALVNPGGATTEGLIALARDIRDTVLDRFGIELRPEPVLVGVALLPVLPVQTVLSVE